VSRISELSGHSSGIEERAVCQDLLSVECDLYSAQFKLLQLVASDKGKRIPAARCRHRSCILCQTSSACQPLGNRHSATTTSESPRFSSSSFPKTSVSTMSSTNKLRGDRAQKEVTELAASAGNSELFLSSRFQLRLIIVLLGRYLRRL